MTAVSIDLVRERSEIAFGQRYRLECMLAIGSDLNAVVSLSEVADQLDLRPSQIQNAFRALVDVGLLLPVASDDHRRKRYRADGRSSAWLWAKELAHPSAHHG